MKKRTAKNPVKNRRFRGSSVACACRLTCLAAIICVAFLIILSGTAPAADRPVIAPHNSKFVSHIELRKTGGYLSATEEGHSLGYTPPPVDMSHLAASSGTSGSGELAETEATLASGYDLRTTGKLTDVRDQGDCGSCWAFATMGSVESVLMPSETRDFSENNLKNTSGFDYSHCEGGHEYMAMAYLARWSGPVAETDDPYSESSDFSPTGLAAQKHIQEVLIIPDRTGSTNNSYIKQAIVDYGAVYTSMYFSGSYYKSANHAYYYNGTGSQDSNHAVTIVGWNDSYSKSNFASTPSGNGAFIVRNSWGSSWGEAGYFYVSYYDSNIGKGNAVFNSAQSAANYSKVYQYDPLGWVSSLGYESVTAWFANIFTAETTESLTAVSFYTGAVNSVYNLYIYTDASSGPVSGSLAGSQTGTIASAGYHTLTLTSPVNLAAGGMFSVVVKLKTPGYDYPVPIEYPYAGYSSRAAASSGQSYISADGTDWTDITTETDLENSNVCLKAFTVETPVKIEETSKLYADITTAYTAAADSQTILAQAVESSEALNLAGGINVTLLGGYDTSFSPNAGYTTIGSLTVSGGTLTVGNIIIK
jgi:C1A family cysteine protease